jgi:membrane-associated phospholipid phosphatase
MRGRVLPRCPRSVLGCCAALCLAAFSARAQTVPAPDSSTEAERWAKGRPSDAFSLNLSADLALTGSSFVLWGMTTVAGRDLGPDSCWLCNGVDNHGTPTTPGNGSGSLNPVDAFFHDKLTGWPISRKSADTWSSVLTYGVAPAGALVTAIFANGPAASEGSAFRTGMIILESAGASGFAGRVIKISLPRKRPFVRYGHGTDGAGPEGSTYDVNDPDAHFSFVSGHTITASSIVFSAATCAQLQGSRAAPYLWAFAGTTTFLVAALRVVAEKHYFSDVLGGAAIGAGTGILLPLLHQPGWLLSGDRNGPPGQLTFSAGPDEVQLGWAGNF